MSLHGPELAFLAIIGLLGALAVCTAIVMRPAIGLYIIFTTTLLVERYPFHHTITQWPIVWENMNTTLGIPGLFFNPVEVIIGLMIVGFLLRSLRRTGDSLRISEWRKKISTPSARMNCGVDSSRDCANKHDDRDPFHLSRTGQWQRHLLQGEARS